MTVVAAASDASLISMAKGLGAILSIFITYPLQNLVTRFQIHSLLENNAAKEEIDAAQKPTTAGLVKKEPSVENSLMTMEHDDKKEPVKEEKISIKLSDWELFKKILKEEGISKLYTGVTLTMFGTSLQQSIFFYVKENLKNYYKAAEKIEVPSTVNFMYGIISGTIHQL